MKASTNECTEDCEIELTVFLWFFPFIPWLKTYWKLQHRKAWKKIRERERETWRFYASSNTNLSIFIAKRASTQVSILHTIRAILVPEGLSIWELMQSLPLFARQLFHSNSEITEDSISLIFFPPFPFAFSLSCHFHLSMTGRVDIFYILIFGLRRTIPFGFSF